MKKFVVFIFFVAFSLYAQKQADFRESQHLVLKNDRFLTYENDPSVFLLRRTKKDTSYIKTVGYSLSRTDSIAHFQRVDTFNIIIDTVKADDFPGTEELYGDIGMEKKELRFYPGRFEDEAFNNKVKKQEYFVPIPDRTVLRIPYSAWQYGILTLPIKVFLNSKKEDTLTNNIQTAVNLSLMVGYKWGSKRYSWLPSDADGDEYESTFSVNGILGVSKVDLKASNTTPSIKGEYSIAALSLGIAGGYQFKSIGTYLVGGLDIPLSKYGQDWDFAYQPWLGLALGLGF